MTHWISVLGALLPSLLLMGCQTLGSDSGRSGEVLARIVERGSLRVGMSGSQPPLNALDRSGALIGFEADLARMLANAMGVRAELVAKPFPELLDALEAGEVDMVMSGLTITATRNMRVAFAGPYFISGKSLLTSSDALTSARDPNDINDPSLRLAALSSSTSERFVQVLVPEAALLSVSSYDEAIQALREGRIDALVADFPICLISALRYRNEGLLTLDRPLSIEPVGAALTPDDPLFINLVQNYLHALHQTGILAELRAAWVQDDTWLTELQRMDLGI